MVHQTCFATPKLYPRLAPSISLVCIDNIQNAYLSVYCSRSFHLFQAVNNITAVLLCCPDKNLIHKQLTPQDVSAPDALQERMQTKLRDAFLFFTNTSLNRCQHLSVCVATSRVKRINCTKSKIKERDSKPSALDPCCLSLVH